MRSFVIIFGPTGVGKTQFALDLADILPIEILNCDVGQMYEPLSIGTAKPDWKNQSVKHHVFDILKKPENYSSFDYCHLVDKIMKDILRRGRIPVIVGGSGFYLRSLFNKNFYDFDKSVSSSHFCQDVLWEDLNKIDPERAGMIHPNDKYRICRAMGIWEKTGVKPSVFRQEFLSPKKGLFIYLDRDKVDYDFRIRARILEMFEQGWLNEVKALDSNWRPFLYKKGLIGYKEIYEFLDGKFDFGGLVDNIEARTFDYIKRQKTFWRGLKALFLRESFSFQELNLTFLNASSGEFADAKKLVEDDLLFEKTSLEYLNYKLYLDELSGNLKDMFLERN